MVEVKVKKLQSVIIKERNPKREPCARSVQDQEIICYTTQVKPNRMTNKVISGEQKARIRLADIHKSHGSRICQSHYHTVKGAVVREASFPGFSGNIRKQLKPRARYI